MISLETSVVLVLAAAAAAVLVAVLPDWRRAMAGGRRLPIWGFLTRRGAALEGPAAVEAELRCELCASQPQCRQILASGGVRPAPGCPNAALIDGSREVPCVRT